MILYREMRLLKLTRQPPSSELQGCNGAPVSLDGVTIGVTVNARWIDGYVVADVKEVDVKEAPTCERCGVPVENGICVVSKRVGHVGEKVLVCLFCLDLKLTDAPTFWALGWSDEYRRDQ